MLPKFLNKFDTIGLAAPSFGCPFTPYNERLLASIKKLKRLKYNIIEGDNIFLADGIASSNTPALRGKEINDLWHTDAKAIFSVGGGEVMIDMLEYVDFDYIKNNPKWFVGYSDNTILTYTINTICDIESIYGSNAPTLHHMKYDSLDTMRMLQGEKEFIGYKSFEYHEPKPFIPEELLDEEVEVIELDPLAPRRLNKRTKAIAYNYDKPLHARLIGGCLDILQCLCGTKFDRTAEYINRHKDEGVIFFMEACDFNSVGVRRALVQLKYAGWFDNVKGFLIGRSHNLSDKSFGLDMINAYYDVLKEFNVPIILNAPIGHLGPSLPIRSGAMATLYFENDNIKIIYD